MKFRKKPVVVEAFRFGEDLPPDWFVADYSCEHRSWFIKTLEGDLQINPDDWIIRGVKGEIYPCKDDVFQLSYERVEE